MTGDGNVLRELQQLLNFDQILELAAQLEEKVQSGEIKTQMQVSTRPLSSIPRRGNIPRPQNPEPRGTNPRVPSDQSQNQPPDPIEIGGLGPIWQQLQEWVALPLKRPDVLRQLGLQPPRGILLVGAPGTGKTLLARSLSQALGVPCLSILAPELVSKYYGEAEANLREVFTAAQRQAPCLIFIDELDALVPRRDRVEGEVEKRLVAQLLGLMDGFQPSQGVIVLGATNRPEALDPALRRPGRFDRELPIPIPDRPARLEILQVLTRPMPVADTVNLEALADGTPGYVGADLKGLCQTAALNALRRQVPDLSQLPAADQLPQLQVNAADFAAALKSTKPSLLRTAQTPEIPQVSWSDIGGLAPTKRTLQEAIAGIFSQSELFARMDARSPKGILLYGPPGGGKTLLAKAVATAVGANFIAVHASDLMVKWVGASEQAVQHLFAQARQVAPCVIFLDELDTLAPARGTVGDGGVGDRVLGQLLSELDGIGIDTPLLVIAATNRREAIDPALLRSGRIELHLPVELPDHGSRLAILQIHNQARPLAANLDLTYWAAQTETWNGADLALLSNRAAIFAIRRQQDSGQISPETLEVTSADFQTAFRELQQQRQSQ
ncbi:MAG: AAA family ATPase [Oscillatoriales cyanobacterium SM2_2_1]|nr:AAA family ATPase [Oscillatoriales cyanobacterium SM2_2_1]